MHKLGAAGNYTLSDHLQSVVSGYGIQIEHLGDTTYRLKSVDGRLNLDQLCPDFVKHNGDIFDLENLKQFSSFLHQPLRSTLTQALTKTEEPSGFRERMKHRKAQESHIHKERVNLHRMLRFVTTGSVEIPPNREENLNKKTAECHAETEQAMRDESTWRHEVEFGNPEQKISSIPNTRFDPETGFHLKIAPETNAHGGQNQKILSQKLRTLLNNSTQGRYSGKGTDDEITFSGAELERFCHAVAKANISALIDGVEFEEAVQEKLASIQTRILDLSRSSLLTKYTDHTTDQLAGLMRATSALTPLLCSDFMREAWARYNFTKREASPLESLGKDIATFMAVVDLYVQKGQTTPAQKEAIATEFYSLIAFSGHIMDALDNGLKKQAAADPQNPDIPKLRAEFSNLKETFHRASISGVDLDAAFLNDNQRDVLQTLTKYAGKPETFTQRIKSAANTPLKAGAETFVDFAKDVINFVREDPKIATTFVGLATALIYMEGGDPAALSKAAEYSTALTIGPDGDFIETTIQTTNIPTDLFSDDNFHWDLKFSPLSGYELYKHFANSNFIVGPSQQFMEWVRSSVHNAYDLAGFPQNYESAFDLTAHKVIQPLADKLFAINMFQNVSHAAFWIWAASRGYQHGLQGFTKLLELSGPVVNLGVQAGASLSDTLRLKPKTMLSKRLMNTKQETPLKYEGSLSTEIFPEKWNKTVPLHTNPDAELPDDIMHFPGTLTIDSIKSPIKTDGLKREFEITAQNLRPTLDALAKFEHFTQHIAPHVIAHESWHSRGLLERIKIIKNSLYAYQKTGDIKAIGQALDDHLEYVLASELRYRGGLSPIYNTLFESAPDSTALKRLMRSAHTTIGKERRAHGISEIRKDIRAEGKAPLKLTGHAAAHTKIFGLNMWDSLVGAAKTLRHGTDKIINKRNIIVGSSVAATCAGLDLAGLGNEFSEAVSGFTGGTIAAGTTAATFLHFNFWEDIVAVHLGTGLGLLFTGAAAGYAHKQYIKPTLLYGLETKPGSYVRQAWDHMSNGISAATSPVSSYLHSQNDKWGHALTRNAKTPERTI